MRNKGKPKLPFPFEEKETPKKKDCKKSKKVKVVWKPASQDKKSFCSEYVRSYKTLRAAEEAVKDWKYKAENKTIWFPPEHWSVEIVYEISN